MAEAADSNATAARTQPQYLLLRKLEDIETRLVSLLDTYLAEPELLEHECDGMFGSASGATAGMNVLDMVVAMVFSRLPRDFAQTLSSEEHFEMLLDHHIHIRRLWKKDFGRLPPRSSAATYAMSSDDDRADKASASDAEHDAHAIALAMAQQQQYDDDSEDDDAGAFGHYERVDMAIDDAPVAPLRSMHSSASSWESVHALDHDDDDENERRHVQDAKRQDESDAGAQSDGYGADYDSNESDDDGEPVSAPVKTAERPRRTRLRRISPRAATASAESVASSFAVDNEAKDAEEDAAAGASKSKKKKAKDKKKKAKKTKDKKSKKKKEEDAGPFQPFACTGALAFLRIAKENELF